MPDHIPGFQNGYARNSTESRYPNLWKGLVGFWAPSAGRQGMQLLDFSGNRQHLASENLTPSSWVPGRRGHAIEYVAASSQRFTRADSAQLSMGDIDFTIVANVLLTDLSAAHAFVAKWGVASNSEYLLRYVTTSSGRFNIVLCSDGSTTVSHTPLTIPSPVVDTWYQVIAWHDSVRNEIGLSVNGVVATTSHSAGVFDGTSTFAIGGRGTTSTEYHTGRIGTVGLWKRLLSDSEKRLLGGHASPLERKRTSIGWMPLQPSTGDSSITLGAVTGSAASAVALAGASSGSLGAVTGIASGTVDQIEAPAPDTLSPPSRGSRSARRRVAPVRVKPYIPPPRTEETKLSAVTGASSAVFDSIISVAHGRVSVTYPELPQLDPALVAEAGRPLALDADLEATVRTQSVVAQAQAKADAAATRSAPEPDVPAPVPQDPTDEELSIIAFYLLR